MIAQELEVTLHMAFMDARQKRHEFITVEHLLLAMLDNPTAAEVLRACAVNMEELRKSLADFINQHTPIVSGTEEVDTQPTLGFQRVIQRAILHVQSSGKKEVNGSNVLVAIFGEKDSHAVFFLHQQGITPRPALAQGTEERPREARESAHEGGRGHAKAIELTARGLSLGKWLRCHEIGRTDPTSDHEALDQVSDLSFASLEVDFHSEHSASHGVHAAEQSGRDVEFRIDVNKTTGQYSVSASELLEIKTRAATLFAQGK